MSETPRRDIDHYDLTGRRIRNWTIRTRKRFVARVREVFDHVWKIRLKGHADTVGERAQDVPGRLVDYGDARLQEPTLENEKRKAETEKLYAEVEHKKAEAKLANQRAEIEQAEHESKMATERVDRTIKRLEVAKRLEELVGDRPFSIEVDDEGNPVVVLAATRASTAALTGKSSEDGTASASDG